MAIDIEKADALRASITKLEEVSDVLDFVDDTVNAENLDFIIADLKHNLSIVENHHVEVIGYANGKFHLK